MRRQVGRNVLQAAATRTEISEMQFNSQQNVFTSVARLFIDAKL